MKSAKPFLLLALIAILIAGAALYWKLQKPVVKKSDTAPAGNRMIGGYDVLGRWIPPDRVSSLMRTEGGNRIFSPESGAVEVTQELIDQGRKEFYDDTFDNEYFLTDVLGVLDGPIKRKTLSEAIAALKGKFTTDLVIKCNRDVTIGGRHFRKGEPLHTGLDVQAGSAEPLGMVIRIHDGRPMVGFTCAACHATLDPHTGTVIEGAPNADLQAGLLLALASNSAAMFRNSGTNPLQFPENGTEYKQNNGSGRLPNRKLLEDAVDADFLFWPPGSFDSTIDMVANPSQIPSSFTFDAWPYGWSGFASIGWFHGLTTLNSNVHALNSDPTTGASSSHKLLGIDADTYLGILLQNASSPKMRLPAGAEPSEFFDRIDPTPGEPGMNSVFRMPDDPNGSIFITDGLIAGTKGHRFAEQMNALSAFEDSLVPPSYPLDAALVERGRTVIERAGCRQCHSGPTFTNYSVIPVAEIATDPSRAAALRATFQPPRTFTPDAVFPVSRDSLVISVPDDITPERTRDLAYAEDGAGGYKVQSLVGLAYTAPYLHDGGVAVGPDALQQDSARCYRVKDPGKLGIPGTLLRNINPDPRLSLYGMIDRDVRAAIVLANNQPRFKRVHVSGAGHGFWIDRQAGFSCDDQSAAVEFLLSIRNP